ncbi:molybdenum cofactor guanylyltransferase [Hyunsoonleella sp. SJ7]|uniref:Probable molybdenum cofactor guanylyltransferase n=1 Tax=Hyunsoonleella aquatilis TaxID=2762758 RepID=A0A923KMC9_9FLAO|nr:molybdenum cofactor guanylyltransferase [Hyunsoonleella aquatilis]MBC3759653.1 molybdenum cofactor guanylyltransferase [Hyunsoonleella aquatilis]
MTDKISITGIILAGGKSSRMGTDKGLLKLNGKYFVQYSIDALKPLVSEILIVSDNTDYDAFGLKRVEDRIKDAGPVSGIYSGLEASKTDYNLVLSCDIPMISNKVLKLLVHAIDNTSEIIQAESDGKSMPLIAIYRSAVKNKFYDLLQQDERRLRVAVKSCNYKNVAVDENDAKTTANINTKEDFKLIEDGNRN